MHSSCQRACFNDNGALYVQDDSPSAEARLGAQFHFDPNAITMSSGNTYTLWQAYQASGTEAARIEHRYSTANANWSKVSDPWRTKNHLYFNRIRQFIISWRLCDLA